jgi:hypothetical protein
MWNRFYYVVFHQRNPDGTWGIGTGSLHFFGAGWLNRFSPILIFWKEISRADHEFLETRNKSGNKKALNLLMGRE